MTPYTMAADDLSLQPCLLLLASSPTLHNDRQSP